MSKDLKFKVGDRVRYLPCKGGLDWQNITLTGFSMGSWDGDDDVTGQGAFGEDELELIDRLTPARMTQPIHPVLERVARAIYDRRAELRAENDRRLAKDGFWPDRHYQPSEIELGRAAIEALLKPDKVQLEAACHDDVWEELDDTLTVDVSRRIYTAMLKPLLGDEG